MSGTPARWNGPPWIFIDQNPIFFAARTMPATIADSRGEARALATLILRGSLRIGERPLPPRTKSLELPASAARSPFS
jgi:hypothetical protein